MKTEIEKLKKENLALRAELRDYRSALLNANPWINATVQGGREALDYSHYVLTAKTPMSGG